MKNEMEVKSHVLEMLKELLMGTDGGKFKPKGMSVEIISASPHKGKDGLDEVLKEASDENPVDEEEMLEDEDCEDEHSPKMSLKEFLKSRK